MLILQQHGCRCFKFYLVMHCFFYKMLYIRCIIPILTLVFFAFIEWNLLSHEHIYIQRVRKYILFDASLYNFFASESKLPFIFKNIKYTPTSKISDNSYPQGLRFPQILEFFQSNHKYSSWAYAKRSHPNHVHTLYNSHLLKENIQKDESHQNNYQKFTWIFYNLFNNSFSFRNQYPSHKLVNAIILIQLHNRPLYIAELINSLSQVEGINHSLIIFSADCFSQTIETLISAITFAPYLKIYYPYSVQIFQPEFMGAIEEILYHTILQHSPNMFKRNGENQITMANITQQLGHLPVWDTLYSLIYECDIPQNTTSFLRQSMSPHYKNDDGDRAYEKLKSILTNKYAITLIKHHWWWKANQILLAGPKTAHQQTAIKIDAAPFPNQAGEEFLNTFDYDGPVLLLEEDYYVLPDALQILQLSYTNIYNRNMNDNSYQAARPLSPVTWIERHINHSIRSQLDQAFEEYNMIGGLDKSFLLEHLLGKNDNPNALILQKLFEQMFGPRQFERKNRSSMQTMMNRKLMNKTEPHSKKIKHIILPILSLGHYKDAEVFAKEIIDADNKAILTESNVLPGETIKHANQPMSIAMISQHWRSSLHNMGLVLDRNMWSLLIGVSNLQKPQSSDSEPPVTMATGIGENGVEFFCAYNDYNWDWTLNALLEGIAKTNGLYVQAIYPVRSMIYHIGLCGTHQIHQMTSNPKSNSTTKYKKDNDSNQLSSIANICSPYKTIMTLMSNYYQFSHRTNRSILPEPKNGRNLKGPYRDSISALRATQRTYNYQNEGTVFKALLSNMKLRITKFDPLHYGQVNPNGGWSEDTNLRLCLAEAGVGKPPFKN